MSSEAKIVNLFSDGRKHERRDPLRRYEMHAKHEACININGKARGLGTVLSYYWWHGVYWVVVDYNGTEYDIPADNVRLLSPAF